MMNVPNTLSLVRIILIPFFVAFYFLQYTFAPFVALAIFIVATFTDFLDGKIARKYNLVTDLGKLLDPIADKILVTSALFVITATNPLALLNILDASICMIITTCVSIAILARELLISAVRQIAASKGKVIQANKWGKAKTAVQMTAIPFLLLLSAYPYYASAYLFFEIVWYIGISLFALSFVLTVISGTVYVVQNKSVFAKEECK